MKMVNREIKNILFISPKRPLWSKSEQLKQMFEKNKGFIRPWYSPPLGLLTIAGVTPNHIETKIIDEDFEQIDFDITFDIVGISMMTQQAGRAYEIADEFRKRNVTVVMGGIHPSVMPNEALQHADSIVIGEAEELWKDVLHDFQEGKMKNIYKGPDNCIVDIKKSPLPRYDLLSSAHFKKNNDFFNFIPVQATRGCPHDCSFCLVTKTYGSKIRKKNLDQVISEVEEILKLSDDPLILFADDNLMVNRKFALELFEALIPYKIKWFGQADNRVGEDDELLKMAYKSGCITLLIGFESLNADNLKSVNRSEWKMKQLVKYKATVRNIQNNGIVAFAAFIIGLDHDTKQTFVDIRDFMIENNCPGQFTFLTPVPGSVLYYQFLKENRLFEDKFWDKSNFFDVVFKHPKMSVQEMEEGLIWLYNEVFNEDNFLNRFMFMKNIYKSLPPRWEKEDSK